MSSTNPNEIREKWLIEPFMSFLNKSLEDSDRGSYKEKIKVLQAPTGFGKTYSTTNTFIPRLFEDIDIVVYVAPNTENIASDAFKIAGGKHGYMFSRDVNESIRFVKQGQKVVLALTWASLSNSSSKCKKERENLLQLTSRSAWFIEECHSWLGVTAQEYYLDVIGHATPQYNGTAYKTLTEVLKETDLVFGVTATTTKQHRGIVGDDCFVVLNEWCPVEERRWLTKWSASYEKYEGYIREYRPSSRKTVDVLDQEEALFQLDKYVVEHHIANISQLNRLKTFDRRIVSKLSSLIVCGGENNNRLSIHVDDAREELSEILARNGYAIPGQWIAVMTDNHKGFYDLAGNFSSSNEDEIIASLNDEESDCQFLLVNNKGTAGIDVFNLTGTCSLRIRAPKTADCTQLSRQIIGRLTRLNSGHGSILKNEYDYDLQKMCDEYCDEYDVNPQVFYETVKIANTFKFVYPSTPNDHWEMAQDEFNSDYTSPFNDVKDELRSMVFGKTLCSNCPLLVTERNFTPIEMALGIAG